MSRATTRNTALHQVTALLHASASGDETALAALTPLVESHFRRVARLHLKREGVGQARESEHGGRHG